MSESWATQQELTFLKNLGTYREGHEMTPMRLQLLANYVKAARERVDWGRVNGEKVIEFAEAQFAKERLKAG
ncbi:hypothetical protein [Candidatus Entotheonella palauensis]|uniref:Uncharacterized protein n=1 Tax=Candidatus Entotheonella gemina TaxID=1429439 RepID=W4L523_9BACT|nr:hypothetical protein [Candidatus Entotheonella palauensis]ETW93198.1 MAG: hypothetical protein ETSY2_51845 [Candidatus Entotheonella gemina]